MRILTPNYKYFLDTNDNLEGKDLIDSQNVVREAWVENVYQISESDFDSTGIFIDIGANIGAVSLYVASFNDNRVPGFEILIDRPKINVIAVEPEPHNLHFLNQNIKANNKVGEIKLVDKAIYSSSGDVSISNRGGNSQLHQEGEIVKAITLEELFKANNIEQCDVLKMDIEGSEYDVLINSTHETLKRIKYLTLEFSATNKENFGSLLFHLDEIFNLHVIGRPSNGGYIYARRY